MAIIDPVSAGLGILNFGMGIFGASQSDKAAKKAAQKQFDYNKKAWKMNRRSMRADRRQAVRETKTAERNAEKLARFQDKTNFRNFRQQLKIREFEHQMQKRLYRKSEELFQQQTTFNKQAQIAANEAEFRRLEDATNEIAFQNQDLIIKAIDSEGAAAVKGQSGRSARKGDDQIFAALGRNQAILADSLLSARADTDATIKKIANDRFGADLAAQAQRMLKPIRTPRPVAPLQTPVPDFVMPRQLRKYDFGPRPIKGASQSSLPSAIFNGLGGAIEGFMPPSQPNMNFNINTLGMGSSSAASYNNLVLGSNPLAGSMSIGSSNWPP